MNLPPSLDDDDGEVVLDDFIIEEYEPDAALAEPEPRDVASEKPQPSWRLVFAIAAVFAGLGAILLRRGLLNWPRKKRYRRFARLGFGS